MIVKTKSNYWLDMGIFLAFTVTMISGTLLWLVLPEGRGSSTALFLGISKSLWLDVHIWSGVGMFLGALFHLVIHWKWISVVGKRYFKKLARQARVNFTLNSFLFAGFLLASLSGLVTWLILPEGGYQGGRNPNFFRTFLGMERSLWGDWHLWSGVAMLVILLIHILNHRGWILLMSKRYAQQISDKLHLRKRNEAVGLDCPV